MNLGFSEMLFIFLLALLLFGPKKLPEIGRQIGKALAEFKRASNDFKSQLENEMRQIEIDEVLKKEKESLTQSIMAPEGTMPGTVTPVAPVENAPPAPTSASSLEAPKGPNA